MYEFKGIDLSTEYIKPSTWDWLAAEADDPDGVVSAHVYDGGYGMIIWTYSADPDEEALPEDFRTILSEAYRRDWRFIVLDADGSDCDLFPSYAEAW